MSLTMSILLMLIIRVLDVSEVEKLSEESGLALGRGLDLCLDLDLLVSSLFFFLDVWLRVQLFFLSSPLLKNIAYTLSFTVVVISSMINPNFLTSGPRAEQAPSRGGPPSSLFRKIMQQCILPLGYAESANFLLFEVISQFLRKTNR